MREVEQGTTGATGRHRVIPRTLCFITYGDEVLLLHGAPDKRIWPNQYNGIGGHVERGEDILSAARREIREEAGAVVTDLRLCGVIHVAVGDEGSGVLLFVFTARALDKKVAASAEGTPVWVHRDRLDELDLVEDLPLILPQVLAMGPCDPPFFAHTTINDGRPPIMRFAPD